jgi:hypothetical protein
MKCGHTRCELQKSPAGKFHRIASIVADAAGPPSSSYINPHLGVRQVLAQLLRHRHLPGTAAIGEEMPAMRHAPNHPEGADAWRLRRRAAPIEPGTVRTTGSMLRDNLDENSGGVRSAKRRPVAKG